MNSRRSLIQWLVASGLVLGVIIVAPHLLTTTIGDGSTEWNVSVRLDHWPASEDEKAEIQLLQGGEKLLVKGEIDRESPIFQERTTVETASKTHLWSTTMYYAHSSIEVRAINLQTGKWIARSFLSKGSIDTANRSASLTLIPGLIDDSPYPKQGVQRRD
jgi:hypothetical protein